MNKLVIKKSTKNTDTMTRTIRMSGSTYDKIAYLAEKNDLSFNNIVNQIIEFGLEHIAEDK